MKKIKISSSILCISAIILTYFSLAFSVNSFAASDDSAIITEAINYVKNAQNSATREELLAAVQSVDSEITLKEDDFYIKHSVDGCYDDDTVSGYPLKIEGSDGAVAAIFYKGDKAITFTYAFAHYDEVIHIEKVAVVGKSEGFTYDRRSGNVLEYTGDADKIVFPKGYKGTLTNISDESFPNRDKVKVIMFKNPDKTYKLVANSLNGFSGNAEKPDPAAWKFKSLVALDIFGGEQFGWSDKKGIFQNRDTAAYLPALKYLYLPDSLDNGDNIGNWCFSYLPSLINVNVPYCNGQIMWGAFRNTGAQEFTYNTREVDFSSTSEYGLSSGTVNEINCNSEPTFLQGLAYVAASVNEQLTNGKTQAEVLSAPGAEAKGWKNMSNGWPTLVSPSDEYFNSFKAKLVSDWSAYGNYYVKSYELSDASSSGNMYFFKLDPKFEEEQNKIINAASDYIDDNKNLCTYDGLLAAVKAVSANVTLAEENFYIRHSVDGCYDNDTVSGYPLKIDGSDGAVTAVLNVLDEDITFVRAFSRQDEEIEISKTAVVGTDAGFRYDSNNNVIGYSGDADKIVFPAGYNGTLEKITDSSLFPNRNNVKVIIFANGDKAIALKSGALDGRLENSSDSYSSWGWKSLKAVQIYKDRNYFWSTSTGKTNIFAEQGIIRNLPALKYLELPAVLDNADSFAAYNVYCMPALENANVPAKVYVQQYAFYNTSLREVEFGLPGYITEVDKWGNAAHNDDGYGPVGGTRNVILDHAIDESIKDITFVQAVAYAAANINSCITEGENLNSIPSIGLSGVEGWSNSSKEYFKAMSIKYLTSWDKGDIADTATIEISHGASVAQMRAVRVNTLLSLTADSQLSPSFNPEITEYALKVPYSVTSLRLAYTLADGAELSEILDNSDFEVGVQKDVKIKIKTADDKTVTYTLSVMRDKKYTANDVLELVEETAANYKAKNDTSQVVYETALKNSILTTGYSLVTEDFYLYKSIMGAKDNYGIITPGYDGYILAEIAVTNGNETVKRIIKSTVCPEMKEYSFKASEISTAKDFMISSDGKSLEYYTGNARKIIIPEGIEKVDLGWFDGDVSNAQVIIFPSTLKESQGSGICSKLRHLEVCVFGDELAVLPENAFENCYMLQVVRLPGNLQSIGANAFAYTCMLEELYVPSSVRAIYNKAFWQAGLRRILIPSSVENVAADAFSYPCNGPSDNSYLVNDVKDENDIKIVGDFYNSKLIDNLRIRVLSPNVTYDKAFSSNQTGWLGHVVTVYAPAEYQGTFDPKNSFSSFNFDMDMSFLEACAYAQVYISNMAVTDKMIADDVLEMAKGSFYSLSDYTLEWSKPYSVNDSTASGTLLISYGDSSFEISFKRPIHKEPELEFFSFEYSTNDTLAHEYTTETRTKKVYTERIVKNDVDNNKNGDADTVETAKRRLVRRRIVYPFYMQTWFIVTVSIAGGLIVLAAVFLIVLKVRRKKVLK